MDIGSVPNPRVKAKRRSLWSSAVSLIWSDICDLTCVYPAIDGRLGGGIGLLAEDPEIGIFLFQMINDNLLRKEVYFSDDIALALERYLLGKVEAVDDDFSSFSGGLNSHIKRSFATMR